MQNPFDVYKNQQSTVAKPKTKKPTPKKRPKVRKTRAVRKKQGPGIPWSIIMGSCFGLLLSFYVMMNTDQVMGFLSRIDVSMTQSQAADEAKKSTKGNNDQEVAASLPVGPVTHLKSDNDHLTMKNASVYKALKQKRRELEKKERRLAQLEEELQLQKVEIEKQLKEMQAMRSNISQRLDRKVAADQESINKLVGVYSNMKPQNAAIILSNVDEGLAIKVLGLMKKQNAAAILNYVSPVKAQVLSEKFTGLKQ